MGHNRIARRIVLAPQRVASWRNNLTVAFYMYITLQKQTIGAAAGTAANLQLRTLSSQLNARATGNTNLYISTGVFNGNSPS